MDQNIFLFNQFLFLSWDHETSDDCVLILTLSFLIDQKTYTTVAKDDQENEKETQEEMMETEKEIFEVKEILDVRKREKKTEYKIRWKGYHPMDDSWEPLENLTGSQELLDDFHRKKNLLCEQCGFRATTKKGMTRHLRDHRDERKRD